MHIEFITRVNYTLDFLSIYRCDSNILDFYISCLKYHYSLLSEHVINVNSSHLIILMRTSQNLRVIY